MGWAFVMTAAMFEMAGVIALKTISQKKTIGRLLLFVGGFLISYLLLYASFDHLDISIAYAVWVGIGTASAVLINMIFFNESKSIQRVASLLLIIIGVVGLKMVS